MARKLKDLVITKVALVPKGSNPDSDIALFKSDDVKKVTFDEVIAGHPEGVREALWKVYDLCWAFSNTVYANMTGGKNVMTDMEKSLNQFTSAVKDALSEANVAKGTKEAADALEEAVIAKAREFLAKHQEAHVATATNTQQTKKREEMTKEELLAELDRVEKAQTAAPPVTPSPEDVLKEHKDLPEPVRKALEKQAEEVKKANERAENAEKVAKEERAARRLGEMIAFVNKELKHLPGTSEEIAKGLIEAQDSMSKESYDLVVKTMKAGSEAVAKTMEESGADESEVLTGSAYQKLEAVAKKLKEDNPKLSKEQAFTKACEQNTDLYKEYRAESRAQATH